MAGYVLTGIVTMGIGVFIGMLIQQGADNANLSLAAYKLKLANYANGRLSRRIAQLRRANKNLRLKVDTLTPSADKEARKQFYMASKTSPNLPQ